MNVRTPFTILLAASLTALPACTSEKQSGDTQDQPGHETEHHRPRSQAAAAPAAKQEWRLQEAPLLTEHIQVTFRNKFLKAGEQYFSPNGSWIIFQAIEVPADINTPPSPHYSMYVARLNRNAAGEITGVDEPILISPAGSANTCGWFHPTQPARVIYGSTIGEPNRDERSGFQVGTNRYRWAFPSEMEIVTQTIRPMVLKLGQAQQSQCGTDYLASPLFAREGYDAECSFDATGRFVLYANVDPAKTLPDGRADADIYIYDTRTQKHLPLVVAPGYDGGPFFSPDGKSICYRSDRKLNDLLQLYVADLKFETDAEGNAVPVGIEREYQVTDNESVNWAPYWHPTGSFLVYGTSEVGHSNYEVFAVEIDRSKLREGKTKELRRRRITFAQGADVLPTFSSDGSLMMWTSQRGPMVEGETKGSSQIWIARWNGMPFSKEWKE